MISHKIILSFCLVLACSGCSKIPFLNKSDGTGDKTASDQNAKAPSIAGAWQFAYTYKDKTFNAAVSIKQDGNQFSADGKDAETGKAFAFTEGEINGQDLHFFKKYADAPPDAPPIEYIGKYEVLNEKDWHGPHMSGEYTTLSQGQQVKGTWEGGLADKVAAEDSPGSSDDKDDEESTKAPVSDKAPDLSGKWTTSYEYDFKTIRSTMFLEQDGVKISGHGVDKNTNEKFTIEKGWYKFPTITLQRKYVKGKDAAASRIMIFKGEVKLSKDGPRMNGKTQGGGDWDAQQVK